MKRHRQRKLRNFLLDAEYQLRYVGQMVGVAVLLTASLGALVYHFHAEGARVVGLGALDPEDEAAKFLQEEFARTGRNLVLALIGFGLVLSLVLAAWQIVQTHKVAGPLYYIAHQVRRMRDGYLGRLHPLRRGDLLHKFFEGFREMHQAMRERAEREATLFEELASEAEAAGQAHIADELRKLHDQRRSSLQ